MLRNLGLYYIVRPTHFFERENRRRTKKEDNFSQMFRFLFFYFTFAPAKR